MVTGADSSIYKSVKSKLLQSLETDIPVADCIPFNSKVIYDGMCVIRQLPKGLSNFGTISEFVLERTTKCQSREVIFVTDQYFETSIKGGGRHKRASTGQIRVTARRQDQTAPKQFKKYLSVGANKTELLQFLLNDWQDLRHITTIG